MKDIIEIIVVLIVATFTTLVLVLTPSYFIEKSSCEEYAALLNVPYQHSFASGCKIKTEGGWIKSKNYIINKEEGK